MTFRQRQVLPGLFDYEPRSFMTTASWLESAIGAAAGLGFSVAVLKFVIFVFQTANDDDDDDDDGDDQEDARRRSWRMERLGQSWCQFVRKLIRRYVLEKSSRTPGLSGADDDVDDENDDGNGASSGTIMTHRGSCHCGSVRFEILAPRRLAAKDGSGRIRYRHTQVKAVNLRVTKGKELLQTYYVETKRTSHAAASRGAHAFCSRCGVHLLYAASQESQALQVNIDCLEEGIHKVKLITGNSFDDRMFHGTPLDGQWEEGQSSPMVSMNSSHSFPLPPSSTFRDSRSVSSDHSEPYSLGLQSRWGAADGTSRSISSESTSRNLFFDAADTPAKQGSYPLDMDHAPLPMKSYDGPDSAATNETESTGTSSTMSQSLPPLHTAIRSSSFDFQQQEQEQQQQPSASSPQLRDQMRYYMMKHLSSAQSSDKNSNNNKL